MNYTFAMKVALFISLISLTLASSQKVVTGFDCETTSGSAREWFETKYGPDGGTNGGFGSSEGRLFEFDCQTGSCRDSEAEYGNWWVTCGFSWKNVNDLEDGDTVIVDLKTEASNNPGSCYDGTYTRALDIDSTGWQAKDTQGDQGHWGFWFCFKKESWATVQSSQMNVVTDLTAKTSSAASGFTRIGQWDTHNGGSAKAYGDNQQTSGWIYIFSKTEQALPSSVCPEGTSQDGNECVPCAPGTYNPNVGGVCASCAPGTYASNSGSVTCASCDVGFFAPNSGSQFCDTCADGHTTDGFGQTECVPNCPMGTSHDGNECVPCAPGTYNPNVGGVCMSCAPGTYAGNSGSIACAACDVGTYADNSGSVACASCHVAFIAPNVGSQASEPCLDGFTTDGLGQTECVPMQCSNPTASHGGSQTRTRFQLDNVSPPASCISETQTRTCSNGNWGTWSGNFAHSSCHVIDDDMTYFWDNNWPSDTTGSLDGTVLFAQSQIFPSKNGIAGDSQPHLTAKRKALVLFHPHAGELPGDVEMTVLGGDGNILSAIIMNDPEDIPKHVGYIDVDVVPEFPSSLGNPYVIQYQSNINKVNDESATFLASKFLDEHNNEVEIKTWDGSWTRNMYLPNGNDVPSGSKVQVTCDSGYTVNVNYPNTMTGGWRMRTLSRGDRLILVLTGNVWIAESDLEHNAYLFGKNFYSATLDAEWVKPGMTLEFKHGEQVGLLDDIEVGAVTEVLVPTIDVGFLTPPRNEFKFARDPTAHREYFQTLPVTRLVVAQYEPLYLSEVMLPTGTLYQTASDDNGGWHSGDMRQFTGKILISHGIDLANYGIHSSSARSESPHPFTCAQMTAHNTRGVYQNGVIVHGGSGGNGMVTLDSSIGNEFSHELGHNYGLGHYVGGFDGSIHRAANEIDSSWQWDSELNVFTPNFAADNSGEDQCLDDECEPPFMGKYKYGKDSMAGGSPQWGANRFTFYTPHVAKRIQDFLESRAIWDPTSSTGFRKWNSASKRMAEFSNNDNGFKIPSLYRVPVTTIIGYYDPDANRRLQSYIFPAMYGAYGFVYDSDESVTESGCSLHVEMAYGGTLMFELNTNIDSQGMNKFHVNVATESGAQIAKIYCQNELLDTRSFDGPLLEPALEYTVNGVPFDVESDDGINEIPSDEESDNIACGSEITGETTSMQNSITFDFIADQADYVFDTCASNFDTKLHVIDSQGNYIESNDDHLGACESGSYVWASHLTANLQVGEQYSLMIEGYSAWSYGPFTIAVSCPDRRALKSSLGGINLAKGQRRLLKQRKI